VLEANVAQVTESLATLAVGRPEEADVAQADAAVRAIDERVERLREVDRQLYADRATLRSELNQLEAGRRRADSDVTTAQARWTPLRERWAALRAKMAQTGLTADLDAVGGDPKIHRVRLVERLTHARDGARLAAEIEAQPHTPEGDLEAWLATRTWLRRCLPARLAETPDPRMGLQRLSGHLAGLEARLSNQERALSGNASDVAHYVRQLRRRARRHVDRLNELLAPIAFGSIAGVRLQMVQIEQMEQLLDGLMNQTDLFRPGLPIDEALEQLFARIGGRGGGERLLDYREYFDLQVQACRRSDDNWRVANPTRMSTGEAIGVGAALMMVVLSAWEQQNRLTRRADDLGTLRLLFLDEANRLSSDNLGVLFELCRTLDLQLLIAAPRVDEAEGNTTYRLTRITGTDGREEVHLTGRRLRRDALAAEAPAE
jgi:chromosome partition protein MukB